MKNEVECARCGTICQIDGEMPRYFAYCDGCQDYAGGFDSNEYAREVMADIADSRPEEI